MLTLASLKVPSPMSGLTVHRNRATVIKLLLAASLGEHKIYLGSLAYDIFYRKICQKY
jgi:hypothetical protein